MRFGIVMLPTDPWPETVDRARHIEALGYDHLWTYDHLSWRRYRGRPWFNSHAVAHGHRRRDRSDPARHHGRVAELPPPRSVRAGDRHPRSRLAGPIRPRRRRGRTQLRRNGVRERTARADASSSPASTNSSSSSTACSPNRSSPTPASTSRRTRRASGRRPPGSARPDRDRGRRAASRSRSSPRRGDAWITFGDTAHRDTERGGD